MGIESLSTSQTSRTLRGTPTELLEELFYFLVSLIRQKSKQRAQPKAFLIDSTTFSLNQTRYPWATFRKTKSGVKLHLRVAYMDEGDVYPDKLTVTNANVHDVNQLEILMVQALATYVFDRGYLDFEQFDRLSYEGYFFVTRIKKNTKRTVLSEYEVPENSSISSDQMVALGGFPYLTEPYRLIEVTDTEGSLLKLLTNRFDLSAEEISHMYRSRWGIELFFKYLKQHTTIKKFFSQDEDRLKNQLFLALIAQLLTYLIKLETRSKLRPLEITRYLFAALWQAPSVWLNRIRGKPKEKKA